MFEESREFTPPSMPIELVQRYQVVPETELSANYRNQFLWIGKQSRRLMENLDDQDLKKDLISLLNNMKVYSESADVKREPGLTTDRNRHSINRLDELGNELKSFAHAELDDANLKQILLLLYEMEILIQPRDIEHYKRVYLEN